MKTIALILFCVLSGLTAHAKPGVHLNFDFFYDTLAPYGEWASVADYGYVWHPADVDEDWTPYSDGYWAYTDAGWTWVSYEEWGGIPYHYGRWVRLHDYGWCWVPDYEWGPAWVSWRQSDDYVGWAPLPPEARWRRTTGFGTWVDTEYDIGPGSFRFCHSRDFGAPFLLPILLPRARNFGFIEQTVNITNITYRSDRGLAFNGGPDYRRLSALSTRPLPALKLVRNTEDVFTPGSRGNVFRNAPRGNTLVVSAPPVAARTPAAPTTQPPVARSFTTAKIDRGWSGGAQDPTHDRIRAHFKQQTEGASPQTAPARPFQPGLVEAVPKKADPKAKVVSVSPVAIGRGGPPAIAVPGTAPGAEPIAAIPPVDGVRRPIVTKAGEPPQASVPPAIVIDPRTDRRGKKPSNIGGAPQPAQPAIIAQPTAPANAPSPPAIITEPRGEKFSKKPFKIAETPPPSLISPPAAPKGAPAPPIASNPQPPQPVIKAPAPVITAEPRGEKFGKRPPRTAETAQPANTPTAAPRISAPVPAPAQPKDDSAARVAREQAEMAARKRDAENAARAADQQRAAENARKHQMVLDEKRKQDTAAAAAADKQRRDSAAAENAHRMAEGQRAAAKEQARIADGQRAAETQRHQNEMNARRAADEGHARQQQASAAAAAEAARRQAVVPRAPAPVAAPPPQRPPVQLPPPQARPAPVANPAPAAPADPRKHKGKDDEEKKK